MLKALELVGFKSFADKTRFEFPRGITVVVGPNGSGKSNVVDAIKWVLGEQSVKSLRGKEMADVIFNGSGSRRPTNVAEITLTLDNSQHLLSVDTPEVHITRRVYRSGEGEYLINRQPSRLRDIRDLLAGTGLGTNAYSIIEQGKVDILLQSSAKDRRMIFEEAAGISRFKMRRTEALRRLERIDQNLLRLSDIVEEVESRLRSVKLQAGKARRFREHTERLQALRTQVGLADWRRLSERLASFEGELADLLAQRDGGTAEVEVLEARSAEAEAEVAESHEAVRQSEAEAAAVRERIAAGESAIEHELARSRDLEQEIARHRRQLATASARAGGLEQQLRETAQAVGAAEEQQRQIAGRLGDGERQLAELLAAIERLRGESHQRRAESLEHMRAAAALGNQISALESQVAAALSARSRIEQRLDDLDRQLGSLGDDLQSLRQERETLSADSAQRAEQLGAARSRLKDHRQQRERRNAELVQLQQQQSAVHGRVSVLEELEKRYEGLSPGVKEVLTAARNSPAGPFGQVCGLLADLLRVSVEAAPLIEVALGETAQHVVVRPGSGLLDHLQQQPYQLSGRVGFIGLELVAASAATARPEPDLEGQPGVLGRADRFVETEPEHEPLAQRLLGRTWIVEKLAHAVALAAGTGAGCRFVTLAGESLSADGGLAVGPRHTSTGLISRRSELRVLREQLAELGAKIQQAQSAVARLEQQIAQDQEQVDSRDAEHRQAVDALGRHSHKITAAEERRSQLQQQRGALENELRAATGQHDSASRALGDAQARRKDLEASQAVTEKQLAAVQEQVERLEADRQGRSRETTEAKVELAKSEERLGNLRTRLRQVQESQQERQRAIAETREELARCLRRADDSRALTLRHESEVAEHYLRKEAFAAQTAERVARREHFQAERSRLAAEAQRIRTRLRKIEEKMHAVELAAGEVRHERTSLSDRLREDYQIELAELEHAPSAEEQRLREEVQKEIDELRQKIGNLGHVNLEALEELDQLESRYTTLAAQLKDLTEAKNALVRIIDKIDADSRRLFTETLETVRGHFVTLFKDLFGGGQADIVLEEGTDILESGLEIVVRPPGKELRSISLLSGGEKTLTCVALLLSIFRSRPSPFCVLDEVDAALDEANIARFTKVIQDFLAWTQFIIVTHSKRTMTCATTMYGVTMQESGISKQVSVRFEDVSDNGEIRIAPDAAATADGEPRAA